MVEFRIEYQIQRYDDAAGDFVEVGFGSSGSWSSLAQCTHMLDSAVVNGEWESEPGQPDPAGHPDGGMFT